MMFRYGKDYFFGVVCQFGTPTGLFVSGLNQGIFQIKNPII